LIPLTPRQHAIALAKIRTWLGLKRCQTALQWNKERPPAQREASVYFRQDVLHKRLLFSNNCSDYVCFNQISPRLGMETDHKRPKRVLGGHPPLKGQPPVTSSRLPMASFPGRGVGNVNPTTALIAGKTNWLSTRLFSRFARTEFLRLNKKAGSVKRMNLKKGDAVFAIIKATAVSVESR